MPNFPLMPAKRPVTFINLTFKTLGLAIVLFGFSACSVAPLKSQMDVQAGETLVLTQPVTIRAGKTRAFIQKGRLIAKSELDRYSPHCSLEIRDISDHDSTLRPDTFRIKKVRNDVLLIVDTYKEYGTFAQNDAAFHGSPDLQWQAFADSDQGQPDPTYDAVRLYLESATQPNIFRLTCAGALSDGNPMDAPGSYRPQHDEINRILGPVGHLK